MLKTKLSSNEIRKWREDKTLTLLEAASLIHVTPQTWGSWENDRHMPPKNLAMTLSAVKDADVQALIVAKKARSKPKSGMPDDYALRLEYAFQLGFQRYADENRYERMMVDITDLAIVPVDAAELQDLRDRNGCYIFGGAPR